ncbi:hypothetical protein [Chryseobacterium sp. EO14]|uniref:hypothetical protein n=1 Tax=Chryseobacterium sp. EO14 TaxID=2950551 RepID=UPI00210CF727|nr:hypothetical protein [Chryseobacterium sp. EO14]MCQ4142729.1 hypothetical protein [Chryseobacterium sp. EO14]
MTITNLHIIDWYDDIITSVVLFEKEVYLFHCIDNNFKTHEKTYYCVKIDEISFLRIESIPVNLKTFKRKEWNVINEFFRSNNKKENAFLVKSTSLSIGENIVDQAQKLGGMLSSFIFA